jgi:hypothetical protein
MEWSYPFEWSAEILDRCVIWEVGREGRPYAAFWAHYAGSALAAEFHIASDPSAPRTVARTVVRSLYTFFRHLADCGVRAVFARPTTAGHADQLRRLGFTHAGPFMYMEIAS